MSSSKMVKIGEISSFVRGITFKPTDTVKPFSKESVVCMRTKNIQSDLDQTDLISIPKKIVRREEQFLNHGDILVSSANSWNLVGKCCWVPKLNYEATAGGFISILRGDKEKINLRYLFHCLNSQKIQYKLRNCGRQTTNISNLNFELAEELVIPSPSLKNQKRIANILDKADAIRRKRQKAIKLADEFLRATFLDMFGDPVVNPKGWKTRPLKDVLEKIDSGWSPKCSDRKPYENEWGILKLGAVTTCTFLENESKALPADLSPRPDLEVQKGDLLFSRKNTYDLVAACALVHATRPKLMLPDLIFRFKIKNNAAVTPAYLWGLLTHSGKRKQVQRLAGGAAGSMPNISKGKLMQQQIELPDIELQKKFSSMLAKVVQLKDKSLLENKNDEILFNSLTQRAFRGEL